MVQRGSHSTRRKPPPDVYVDQITPAAFKPKPQSPTGKAPAPTLAEALAGTDSLLETLRNVAVAKAAGVGADAEA